MRNLKEEIKFMQSENDAILRTINQNIDFCNKLRESCLNYVNDCNKNKQEVDNEYVENQVNWIKRFNEINEVLKYSYGEMHNTLEEIKKVKYKDVKELFNSIPYLKWRDAMQISLLNSRLFTDEQIMKRLFNLESWMDSVVNVLKTTLNKNSN